MKDSTLYKILGVIVGIFVLILGVRMLISSHRANKPLEIPDDEVVEVTNQEEPAPKNETVTSVNQTEMQNQVDDPEDVPSAFNQHLSEHAGTCKGQEVKTILENIHHANLVADKKETVWVEFEGTVYTEKVYEIRDKIKDKDNYELSFAYEGNRVRKMIIK